MLRIFFLIALAASAQQIKINPITELPDLVGSSSGGATSLSGLTDLKVSRTSSTVLNIAAGNGKVGSSTSIFSAATGTLSGSSASGTVYVYVTSGGVLTMGHNAAWTLTCSGCTTATGVSAFPADSIPLATWTVTSTTWDTSGGTDYRALNSVDRPITSSTLTVTTTTTGRTIEYTSPIIASGTATLGTSAISANTCASVVTVAATGTLTSHVIAAGFTADVSGVTGYGAGATDGLFVISYPTANNVNFKVCNPTGASITPGAATLNWRVL